MGLLPLLVLCKALIPINVVYMPHTSHKVHNHFAVTAAKCIGERLTIS